MYCSIIFSSSLFSIFLVCVQNLIFNKDKLISSVNYHLQMSSLASLFQQRSKHKQSAIGQLFRKEEIQKYEKLEEDPNPQQPVYLKPEPKKEEPEDLETTIFVGNVPLAYTHKNLRKIFGEYGKISKIWFRSVPVEQTKLGKKANCILKKYQEGADSMNAYVKFEEKQSAQKSCAVNGSKVDDHTLRVSLCLDDNLDYETTIFVGNLPLDVREEEVRQHFLHLGQIVNVRVVKDKQTFKGIGIGYVRFSDKEGMFNALRVMNGSVLKGRPLRVKRAVEKGKLQKKFRKVAEKKMNKKGYTPPQSKGKGAVQGGFRGGKERVISQTEMQSKQKARKFHFKRKMIKK